MSQFLYRVIEMLRRGGLAITLTSVTDMVAFLANSFTVLPVLRY